MFNTIINLRAFYLLFFVIFLLLSDGKAGGKTVSDGIVVPGGYKQIKYREGGFSSWVQNLPLKGSNLIKAYDGSSINSGFYNVFFVVDMPLLFKRNIEQCADYCMRFWAEYHKDVKKLQKLYLFDYSGKKRYFRKSQRQFYDFLKWAMIYSNSYSLKRGCIAVSKENIMPGDMIVQNKGGGIGHVSMVLNVCKNDNGGKLYLIGFSYMPAQEFHIEKATSEYGKGGWFTYEGYYKLLEKYFNYGKPVIRRFK